MESDPLAAPAPNDSHILAHIVQVLRSFSVEDESMLHNYVAQLNVLGALGKADGSFPK